MSMLQLGSNNSSSACCSGFGVAVRALIAVEDNVPLGPWWTLAPVSYINKIVLYNQVLQTPQLAGQQSNWPS